MTAEIDQHLDEAARVMNLTEAQRHDLALVIARASALRSTTNVALTDVVTWGYAAGLQAGFRRGRAMRYSGRMGVIR